MTFDRRAIRFQAKPAEGLLRIRAELAALSEECLTLAEQAKPGIRAKINKLLVMEEKLSKGERSC